MYCVLYYLFVFYYYILLAACTFIIVDQLPLRYGVHGQLQLQLHLDHVWNEICSFLVKFFQSHMNVTNLQIKC